MMQSSAVRPYGVLLENYLQLGGSKDQLRGKYAEQEQYKLRYVPFLRNVKIRTTIGFLLLVLSATLSVKILGKGRIEVIIVIIALAWICALFLTDKYVHKYPQRYLTYLIASHLKAAIIMAFLLWIMGGIAVHLAAPPDVLWTGFIFFVFADVVASVPRRRDILHKPSSPEDPLPLTANITADRSSNEGGTKHDLSLIDKQAIIRQIRTALHKPLAEFITTYLPDLQKGVGEVLVLDEATTADNQSKSAPVGLLVSGTRINDVRRLNKFFLFCVKRITMGGYFVGWYVPLENVAANLKRRYTGLLYWTACILHFLWYRAFPKIPWLNVLYFSLTKGRNRVLSKAEIWGRLAYCGMNVIAEAKGDYETYIIAQRVALPAQNKKPSYYPIVALEKVGLDGEIIHTHKIRSMFPFSEFLQKRIFTDNGLASTGKFANDFRLTEYGSFLRRYWLDELPGILDWLRGDVKLVGMRATSRHFLSLYPGKLYNLYVQIKPGLIPPIFDESTNGFDQIVEVELTYLQRYWDQPFRTDVRYLIQTFTDIVFRGIRSK